MRSAVTAISAVNAIFAGNLHTLSS